MEYTADDFMPATPGNVCGCEKQGYLVPCDIRYVDKNGIRHRVCFRQQCQECGFVRKNRIGKNLYYDIVDSNSKRNRFVFLPEYFWAPDEYVFDENKQYDKMKKLCFLRKILTLANMHSSSWGHLDFTKEQIDKVKF